MDIHIGIFSMMTVSIEFIQTIKLDTIARTLHLKTFLLDNDYDCFSDYEDGIFEVTGEQYNDFYRGKNISMTFQREVNVLYMLKKKWVLLFYPQIKKRQSYYP